MEDIENVKCPYCGGEIQNTVEQCPFCGEFFTEPRIDNIKLPSIGQYVTLNILSIGLYSLFWIILNYKTFKNISNVKDTVKLKFFFGLALVSAVTFFVNPLIFNIITKIIYLFLSYRILRIIEKFSVKKYNAPISHSEAGWFFFDILYVVYFLDTYKQRVHDPDMRNHMEFKGWLKYCIIIAILALIVFCANFLYVSTIL